MTEVKSMSHTSSHLCRDTEDDDLAHAAYKKSMAPLRNMYIMCGREQRKSDGGSRQVLLFRKEEKNLP